jgi:pimeloyl-ACP methyl ester carboxylesterase
VQTAGPPDGAEAIVFVHGNPGPAGDWRALLTRAGELGRQSRLTCPAAAMPASRRTSAPRWTATPDTWWPCSISSASPAHIVAHDFGGPWALAWAARHPDALASATLINTGVLIG